MDADDWLAQTLGIAHEETFTPKLHTALVPDFVGQCTATGIAVVFGVTILSDKVLQHLAALGLLAALGQTLGLDENHLLHTHQRPVVVVQRVAYATLLGELDVGVGQEAHLTTIAGLEVGNGVTLGSNGRIGGVGPNQVSPVGRVLVSIKPPALTHVGVGNLVVEQHVDAGHHSTGGTIAVASESAAPR